MQHATIHRVGKFLLLVVLVVLAACGESAPSSQQLQGSLPIEAPQSAQAGDEIDVAIGPVSVSNGTPIGLVTVGSHGPRVYNASFNASGMAYFTIPSDHTRQSGYLALIAVAQQARGETNVILETTTTSPVSMLAANLSARAPGVAWG